MAGLLNSGGRSPEPSGRGGTADRAGEPAMGRPAPSEGKVGGGAGDGPAPNASPEEQAQYDQFVENAYSLIYDQKTLPAVLQRLQADEPVPALAHTAAMVVMTLEDNAETSGAKIPGDVVMHGGTEVLEDLANLAREAKIHEYTEQELEAALYQGMDIYRQARQQQGKLDPQMFQQDLAALQQADQSGELERMLPAGTKDHFAQMLGGGRGSA